MPVLLIGELRTIRPGVVFLHLNDDVLHESPIRGVATRNAQHVLWSSDPYTLSVHEYVLPSATNRIRGVCPLRGSNRRIVLARKWRGVFVIPPNGFELLWGRMVSA